MPRWACDDPQGEWSHHLSSLLSEAVPSVDAFLRRYRARMSKRDDPGSQLCSGSIFRANRMRGATLAASAAKWTCPVLAPPQVRV